MKVLRALPAGVCDVPGIVRRQDAAVVYRVPEVDGNRRWNEIEADLVDDAFVVAADENKQSLYIALRHEKQHSLNVSFQFPLPQVPQRSGFFLLENCP